MNGFKKATQAGIAMMLVGLMTLLMGAFVAQAATSSSTSLDLNPSCNGAFTPGQLGSLSKTVSVDPDESVASTSRTITFTITYPTDNGRNGGRLLDCIMVGDTKHGLIASLEDTTDHTSGTFTGSYSVALTGTNPDADIHVDAGEMVCDVGFLTGNDGGNGQPSGQKTPSPVCTSVLFPGSGSAQRGHRRPERADGCHRSAWRRHPHAMDRPAAPRAHHGREVAHAL